MNRFRGMFAAAGCAAALVIAPATWGQSKKAAGDAAKGKDIFEMNCSVCHNADNAEKKVGPGLKGLFKKEKLANGKKPTEANIRAVINAGGNGMPSYQDLLSDEEKSSVIAYLKTL
ncbi:MAG TPA: cytochrome c [Bryobacteraceae bacterium]|nr:cytochrome c [Bryobacteraceae bacterium]